MSTFDLERFLRNYWSYLREVREEFKERTAFRHDWAWVVRSAHVFADPTPRRLPNYRSRSIDPEFLPLSLNKFFKSLFTLHKKILNNYVRQIYMRSIIITSTKLLKPMRNKKEFRSKFNFSTKTFQTRRLHFSSSLPYGNRCRRHLSLKTLNA